MSQPLVTVVMATFNQSLFLAQALDSLLDQSVDPSSYEIIVIDDGSTDGTAQILHHYESRARLVRREQRGLAASCNDGLLLAQGEYFARVDSDDLVDREWLAAMVEALGSRPTACCAFPDRYEWWPAGRHYVQASASNLYSLVACGTLFRTADLRRVGGFRSFFWEEYDLYLRLRPLGPFVHVPRPLYVYRRHEESMTHSADQRWQGWLELVSTWGAAVLRQAGSHDELDRVLHLVHKETGLDGQDDHHRRDR